MPEELAKSLDALIPVFQKLEKSLEHDRNERQSFVRFMKFSVLVVVVAVVVILTLIITFHSTTTTNNAHYNKISSCVFPPAKLSPPGTPTNKLSCYERQQIVAGAEITAILKEERNTLQDALDHAIPGNTYKLPEPSFTLPPGGPNANTKGTPPTT